MEYKYMCGQSPCTIIDVDFINEKIAIKNRTDDVLYRTFGVIEHPTWQQFQEFLEDRCFPKTKGRTADDNLWIKFKYYSQE